VDAGGHEEERRAEARRESGLMSYDDSTTPLYDLTRVVRVRYSGSVYGVQSVPR